MALWNQRNLKRPISMAEKVKSKLIKPEICGLGITISNMLTYFQSMEKYDRAAALVTRMCNMWNLRFRHFPGFRMLRQLNQTLLRIKRMNLNWDILNIHGFLPEVSFIPIEVKLPVRSNLECLLVRLQGLVKLHMRAIYLIKEIAANLLKQIADAFFYPQNSVMLALMGELWVLSRAACRQTDQFYVELYAYLPILPEAGECWLPIDYTLPESLAKWLGKEYEEEILRSTDKNNTLNICEDPTIFTLFARAATDENEVLGQVENIAAKAVMKEERRYEPTIISALPKMLLLEALRADTGVEVSNKTDGNVSGSAKSFSASDLDHIRSKYHVTQFIADERAKRAENRIQAITKKVSNVHFDNFNSLTMREYNRLSSADFVAHFKKQLFELMEMQ